MQYPQFVLVSEFSAAAAPDRRRPPSAASAGDHHQHPAAATEPANIWDQSWLEFHRGNGGGHSYTCHLCHRPHLPSAQAVRYHVQEPVHLQHVQQLQRDRQQAGILLERWNRIHHAGAAAAAVQAPQSPSQSQRPQQPQGFSLLWDAHMNNAGMGTTTAARRRSGGGRDNNNSNNNSNADFSASSSSSAPPSSSLLVRVGRLGLPAWRDAVQACLFRHLSVPNSIDIDNNDDDDDRHLQQAYTLLHKYERAERISLLELAVWKAVCIVDLPQPEAAAAEEEEEGAAEAAAVMDYYAVSEWFRSGWKARKAEQRQSRAVNIVLSRVVPFLDSGSDVDEGAEPTVPASTFVLGETARPARPPQPQQQQQQGRGGLRLHRFVNPSVRRGGRPHNHPAFGGTVEQFDPVYRRPRPQQLHYRRRQEDDDTEAAGLVPYAMEDGNADDDDDDDDEFEGLAPWLRDMDGPI